MGWAVRAGVGAREGERSLGDSEILARATGSLALSLAELGRWQAAVDGLAHVANPVEVLSRPWAVQV